MKRLSGKLLIDTYSKRSKTLIEKVSTAIIPKLTLILTSTPVGQRIGKIDRRIRGDLHCKVVDHLSSVAFE